MQVHQIDVARLANELNDLKIDATDASGRLEKCVAFGIIFRQQVAEERLARELAINILDRHGCTIAQQPVRPSHGGRAAAAWLDGIEEREHLNAHDPDLW
jgi:hypothetical protein